MWVDILGSKLHYFENLDHKVVMAKVVEVYARQAVQDRDIASRLGVEESAYRVTPGGKEVYDRFAELETDFAVAAFILGSLEPPPEGYDSQYITTVEPWIEELFDEMTVEQSELRQLLAALVAEMANPEAEAYRQEVKDLYEVREPQELGWYLEG
jgi:hypothetical protein